MNDQLIVMHVLDIFHPEIIHKVKIYWGDTYKDNLIQYLLKDLYELCQKNTINFDENNYSIAYYDKVVSLNKEALTPIFTNIIKQLFNNHKDAQLSVLKDKQLFYQILIYMTDLV